MTALEWAALVLAFVDGVLVGYVAGGRVTRDTHPGAAMSEAKETTHVIRRLRELSAQNSPRDDELAGELLELATALESIDARYERQEREQPGDGPDPLPPRVHRRKPGGRPATKRAADAPLADDQGGGGDA